MQRSSAARRVLAAALGSAERAAAGPRLEAVTNEVAVGLNGGRSGASSGGGSDQRSVPAKTAAEARPDARQASQQRQRLWWESGPVRQQLQQQPAARAPGWHSHQPARGFAAGGATGDGDGGCDGGDAAASLQASMDKLVDAAVGLVEAGKLGEAVAVLQQGIDALGAAYPGSPELGELHNQAALLLFLAGQPDAAATHASAALEVTQAAFGAAHPLTAHRLLRLATVRVGQGRGNEARPLLAVVADMLSPYPEDIALQEAKFYLGLLQAGEASSADEVAASDDALLAPLKAMAEALGPDSMIVRLAMGQHTRLVGLGLDAGFFPLGEALFKQHIRLQEALAADSPELGLALYQLAVSYYAHDMLGDAGAALQRGAALLRQQFPQEHDLVQMCMHRLGMICAAGHDPQAAKRLLASTRSHYAAQAAEQQQQQGGGGSGGGGAGAAAEHPLVHEADAGLAMAEFKLLDPRLPADERRERQAELLRTVEGAYGAMARLLGPSHLLVQGAQRFYAQLAAIAAAR